MHNELLFLFAAKQITLQGIIGNVKTMVEIKKNHPVSIRERSCAMSGYAKFYNNKEDKALKQPVQGDYRALLCACKIFCYLKRPYNYSRNPFLVERSVNFHDFFCCF